MPAGAGEATDIHEPAHTSALEHLDQLPGGPGAMPDRVDEGHGGLT